MIETIYDVAKKEMDYSKICDFLGNNLTMIDDDYCNEGYYKASTQKYSITPSLNVVATYSFDIFGSNKTGGYFMYVEDVVNGEQYNIFEHSITTIDGTRIENEKRICEKVLVDELLKKEQETSTFTEENFVIMMSKKSDNCIFYWKNLPKNIRLKVKYVDFIMETIYENAICKLNEIRDYYMISPYGGTDISYFPNSYGECFFDMAKELLPFMDMTKKAYYSFLIKFIEKKDVLDEFIETFDKNVELAKIIRKNGNVIENIKLYNSCILRKEKLEESMETCNYEILSSTNQISILAKKLEEMRVRLDTNSLVEKILLDVFGRRTKGKKELLFEIANVEREKCFELDKIACTNDKISKINKRIKKMSYVLNNELYKMFEKEFVDSLDDYSFDDYMMERKVPNSKYTKFVAKYADYVI